VSLVAAAEAAQRLGVEHLNLNLGCPFGRMTSNSAGGVLLKDPEKLAVILTTLRQCVRGTFSVKARAGFERPDEILSLLDMFAESATNIDFLILHPRTVRQRYDGSADHRITAEAVKRSKVPVIANGDVFTAADSKAVLEQTDAAGLMLGRGAIADPLLFQRIRGTHQATSSPAELLTEMQQYLFRILGPYEELFCGDHQVLRKMKEVASQVRSPVLHAPVRRLQKSKTLADFGCILKELSG